MVCFDFWNTETALINELVDELNELKLSTMAATLDDLYHKPGFLEMDRLTLIELLEKRNEQRKSTIVCSQRDPDNWKAMILNDEVSANSIMKRATKHYTIKINTR